MRQFKHEDTERLFAYWRSLGDVCPPSYRAWDPVEIPALMPNVLILEREATGNFIHRFAGTGVCEFSGLELTGRPLADVMAPALLAQTVDDLDRMLTLPCAFLSRTLTRSAAGRVVDAEYVILPLRGPDDVPDRVVIHMGPLETLDYGDTRMEVGDLLEAEWIDIGFGVPADPPGGHGSPDS